MENLCILIVDDHALFRTGLNMILKQDERIETVLEAGTVMEALNHSQSEIDLILSDIQMPGLNGLDGIKVLKEKFSNTPIIMLSASHDTGDMQDALDSGAGGFLPKSSSAEMIIKAISAVLNGKQCFPEDKILRLQSNNNKQPKELTSRQLQVLSLLCEGKPNKIIARELNLSENTVRVHVSAILSLLSVASRSEAMLVAQKQGLIGLSK
ncbi:MAG: response regulator transcription factor [Spongiibacteraceae bacterium]|nr:response regulator transcription factor [Spongiibacteraceae bacterium]